MNVSIYTDGGCSHQKTPGTPSGVGGFAAILFVDGVQIDAVYGGAPDTTNNQMELKAIIEGLKLLPVVERIYCQNCGLTPFTTTGGKVVVAKDVVNCDVPIEVCHQYNKHVSRVPVYPGATVFSDSEYCIKGAAHWLEMWKTNGWRTKAKQPVKNQDLWQEIDAMKKLCVPQFQWVKGHSGVPGNELADQLATQGAQLTAQYDKKPWSIKL